MKKIYILGNFYNDGIIGNDSSNLDSYMELGWEIFTTGFWAKLNLKNSDYISTSKDRLFMYEHITKNLIPREELNINEYNEVYEVYNNKFEILKQHNEFEWTKEMNEAICKNNLQKRKEKNYVCVQIRNRDHCPWRNGQINKWEELILKLSKKYDKVYVVGKGNDNKQFPKNIEILNKLKDFCELIYSDGCIATYGSSSGLMALNYIYGRQNLPVNILYTEDYSVKKSNHILFFGDKTNVSGILPKFFFNLDEMIETV